MKPAAIAARRLIVTGRVQGVGFRPFVYRLAHEYGLCGWVLNATGTVHIHVEGSAAALEAFVSALTQDAPPLARPELAESRAVAVECFADFSIRQSAGSGAADIHLPPDLFVCDDCLAEMADPAARRYRYPFITCTQCGPRYTIIRALPYDRPATTMAAFPLCAACRAEYENPADRRFHAEPLACPVCGPSLTFEDAGETIADNEVALAATVAALRVGRIVAVKGIGGYHLMADAVSEVAVTRLRERKARPTKPFAVMFPMVGTDGLDSVRRHCVPDTVEAAALADPARPIVLVRRHDDCDLADGIAPGLDEIGCFLPYSPLHHLLLGDFGGPLVATSANLSGEPVLTKADDVRARLGTVADAFLHYDRPIARPADDTVMRAVAGKVRPIRLGRGLAPVELTLPRPLAEPTLAVGGQMKATVALGFGDRAVVSPHIGDLDSPRSLDVFAAVIADLQALYDVTAMRVACDAHPAYAGSRWAEASGLPVHKVFHHHAHASALAAEHSDIENWLVFAWDGVGYGEDGTLWGGEALVGRPGRWRRAGSMRPFRPVGGDRAARAPWRSAAALLWATGRNFPRPRDGLALARAGWEKHLNAPETSAIGRLFDAAASLVLGVDAVSFEGEGPMRLEAVASGEGEAVPLPLYRDDAGLLRLDWAPLLPRLMDDGIPAGQRAADFHASLAGAALAQALAIGHEMPYAGVGLTGGVFQNRRLTEAFLACFADAGLAVRLGAAVPVNDAGLSFGQLVEAAARRGDSEDG